MKKEIAWESWNAKEIEIIESLEDFNQIETETDSEDGQVGIPIFISQTRNITTPFGLYDESSMFRPAEKWDCWICHTNFNITASIFDKVNRVAGVESLVVMGRYTFCIGIAKLFKSSAVKKVIEKEIKKNIIDLEEVENLIKANDEIKKVELIQGHLFWSVLMDNDGLIKDYVCSYEYNEDYINKIKILEKTKEKNAGYKIFSSDTEI